jgi:endonuclease G
MKMTSIKAVIVGCVLCGNVFAASPAPTVQRDYQGFTVWLNCKEHAAFKFRYNAGHDLGNYPREDNFRLDPQVPYECQPSSTNSFSTKNLPGAPVFHRGHLVAANHLDYSEQALRESFFMTNILPMTQQLNLGAWSRTEEITECYRDRSELLVLGGAVWGNTRKDKRNDYFLGSHNIRTPDWYWKLIIKGDGETIAWYLPNDTTALSGQLDRYLIKPAQLELKVKVKLPEVPKPWKWKKPKVSWPIPADCRLN